jgi:hypothetical protein
MRSLRRVIALLLTATACSDSNGLPDPTLPNVERSETLHALVGTPVSTPSAYALEGNRRVRTDLSVDFDFAYNVEPDGRPVFIPRAALGIDTSASLNPGFQRRTETTFEAITEAPSNGYISDQVVPIAVGDRFIVRGRITCNIGVPKYAKLEVTGFDEGARTVTFRMLTDENCGFKGLEPGLPDR